MTEICALALQHLYLVGCKQKITFDLGCFPYSFVAIMPVAPSLFFNHRNFELNFEIKVAM